MGIKVSRLRAFARTTKQVVPGTEERCSNRPRSFERLSPVLLCTKIVAAQSAPADEMKIAQQFTAGTMSERSNSLQSRRLKLPSQDVSLFQSSAARTSYCIPALPSDESLGYFHCVRCADQYKATFVQSLRVWMRRIFFAALLLPIVLSPASAQKRPTSKELELARRLAAIELLTTTAENARTFKDLFYRPRVQALAADALWPHDETRARAIFRRAWDAATASDKSEQEAEEKETGVPSILLITEARDEVLRIAADRDPELAQTFLNELLTATKDKGIGEENNQQTKPARTPWRELSPGGQRRLALAYEMLKQNNFRAAAAIARPPIMEGASGDAVIFILRLREQNAEAGNELYRLLLLTVTRNLSLVDANDVLLLSAPIVSPNLLVVVDNRGALQFRPLQLRTPAISHKPIRDIFLGFAGLVLSQGNGQTSSADNLSDAVGRFVAIGRLLPLFEREWPESVAGLRMRSASLANQIGAARSESLNSQLSLTRMTSDQTEDPLRAQLNQLGRARDSAERDRISLDVVRKASALRLWDRARRAAGEIENVELRRRALSFIAMNQIADLLRAYADDKETNFENLAKFVRSADVPAAAIAWGLAQTAVIAARQGDSKRATAMLDEAEVFAGRTPAGTRERVAAYTAVTRLAVGIDVKRAWQLLPEIVRAINAVEDYAGDENSIELSMTDNLDSETADSLSMSSDVFRVSGIFAAMAALDSEKALTAARALGNELPQAFVSLSIARAMLAGGQARVPVKSWKR